MGMDVYGLRPKTQAGEYFRNNVWWWHPLWNYCATVSPELANKVKYPHSNDGDGLNAADSRKLGFAILASIESGFAVTYVAQYYDYAKSAPQQSCYCVHSNNTSDLFGGNDIDDSFATAESLVSAINTAETTNDLLSLLSLFDPDKSVPPTKNCRLCSGTGLVDDPIKMYHINLENISSFAKFLIDCGGFQIC